VRAALDIYPLDASEDPVNHYDLDGTIEIEDGHFGGKSAAPKSGGPVGGEPAGGGGRGAAPRGGPGGFTASIRSRIANLNRGSRPGRSRGVFIRRGGMSRAFRDAKYLAHAGTGCARSNSGMKILELKNGWRIQLRYGSRTGGPALDVYRPTAQGRFARAVRYHYR
jgi:hypothetical protein